MDFGNNKLLQKFDLWPHQQQALFAIGSYLKAFINKSTSRSALIQMPTGSGKSGVIAITARYFQRGGAVLVLTPRISLKNQLYKDIENRFFKHIGYHVNDLPKTVSRIDDGEVPNMDGDLSESVFVTTIQKLVSLKSRQNDVFKNFVKAISLVIVDEGHYEPAKEWSKVIREICTPKIVFTATPYRNDFKVFDIDLDYAYVLPFKEAVSESFLRNVKIIDRKPFDSHHEFVDDVLEFYNSEFQNIGIEPPRVIIRCDDQTGIRHIAQELISRGQSVIGIHERFSNNAGEPWERKSVPDPEYEPAIFWIHQFKLLEGIDDPRFQVLALYKKIENGRAFVQQVGRIIRNPSQEKNTYGYVLDHWSEHHQSLWDGFLTYDKALSELGVKAFNLSTGKGLFWELIKSQPRVSYIDGKFRSEFDFEIIDPYQDIQLPLRINLLAKLPKFAIDDVVCKLVDQYEEKDRVAEVYNLKTNTSVIVSVNCSNSAFLRNHVFIEADLHLAIIHEFDDYVGVYETSGLSMLNWDNVGLGGSIDPKRLRFLFNQNQFSKLTSVTLKNSNLGSSVIRTRSITAKSIESIVPGTDDYAQICTTAEGYSNDKYDYDDGSLVLSEERVRRYVGFSRGRVSQASSSYVKLSEYMNWLESLNLILNSNSKSLAVLSRYAQETIVPSKPAPKNVLIDVSEIQNCYFHIGKNKPIEIEDLCFNVGSKGQVSFIANGTKISGNIAFNHKRKRYELISPDLDKNYFTKRTDLPGSIVQYLNQFQAFRIIPEDWKSVYVNGQFYRPNLKIGSKFDSNNYAIGHCFITDKIIGDIKSEKGELVRNNGEGWTTDSLFGIIDNLGEGTEIEDLIGKPDILVCDDMGKEAADFFICNSSVDKPTVILIHAKASAIKHECSASGLHDICAQAVKNLGYLAMFNQEKPTHVKSGMWEKPWNNSSIGVVNKRIRRGSGTSTEVWQKIQTTINNPMVQKEVWLILGQILSRNKFEEKLGKSTPAAEALQTAYLLHATMTEVAAIGAKLRIICGP